jgi:large subunit ribosomal protein L19
MNLLQQFEADQMQNLLAQRESIPDFRPGDTVRVHVRIVEMVKGKGRGAKDVERERFQAYEGVCIARRFRGLGSSFTVRKVVSGLAVERVFQLFSPSIGKIETLRHGRVRRNKLYFLRHLSGKNARIKEKRRSSAISAS